MGEFFDALTKKRGGNPEPLQDTVNVLAYEVGLLIEHMMFMKWALQKGDDRAYRARLGFFKSELMDVIAQTQLICESLFIDFEEWRQAGVEKAIERFTGKEEKK